MAIARSLRWNQRVRALWVGARTTWIGACLTWIAACAQIGLQNRPVPMGHREVTTSSGVTYEDEFLGSGPAAMIGDEVEVDYTLWLENGTRVDSTLDRGQPVPMRIGEAPVKGLDHGLIGMQPQGRRRIQVPPELGYGAQGVEGMIPPNARLVFEIHVLAVKRR